MTDNEIFKRFRDAHDRLWDSSRTEPKKIVEVSIDLKPCPFCGQTNVKLEADLQHGHGDRDDYYFIKCDNCGSTGSRFIDKARPDLARLLAKHNWNKRAETT